MGIANRQSFESPQTTKISPSKMLRKTAINLTEYETLSYWLSLSLKDFYSWINDAIEVAEERRKGQK